MNFIKFLIVIMCILNLLMTTAIFKKVEANCDVVNGHKVCRQFFDDWFK